MTLLSQNLEFAFTISYFQRIKINKTEMVSYRCKMVVTGNN